ncbi:MAG TPA: hypothetical protein VL360_09170 [Gammaproteobacteria bacterium]|jgi:hypothetical protein|nr:hypothetical protein [Gammaproteobacteria bacterium]
MITSRDMTLPDIRAALQAHADVLFHHLKYLSRIRSGHVSDEDIIDYINELFDTRIKHDGRDKDDVVRNFKNENLPILIEIIKARYGTYLKMLSIASHANDKVAKSSLALALEYEMFYAMNEKKALEKKPTLKVKILKTLHSVELLKSINDSLNKMLPSEHAELKKCIYVSTISKPKMKSSTAWVFYQWDNMLKHTKELLDDLKKVAQKKKTSFITVIESQALTSPIDGWNEHIKNIIDDTIKTDMNEIIKVLTDAGSTITQFDAQVKEVGNFLQTLKDADRPNDKLLDFMSKNVDAFYKMYPSVAKWESCLQRLTNVDELVQKEYKRVNASKKRFDAMRKLVDEQKSWLQKQRDNLVAMMPKSFSDKDDEQCRQDVLNAIRDCELHASVFSGPFTMKTDMNAAKASMKEYQRSYQNVLTEVKKLDEAFNRHIKTQQEADAKKSEETLHQERAAREALLAEGIRKNEKYKEEVQAKRRMKKEAGRGKSVIAAKPVAEAVVTFVNQSVEERLRNLNNAGIKVLTSLFNFEKGVRYDDVCRVITDQLGGKIMEVGNGSSHKRILLDKYMIELTAHEGFEISDPDIQKKSVATGGMFKQHGGSHQSGVMVRFNMELIIATLMKAGITLEVIQGLTNKPYQSK